MSRRLSATESPIRSGLAQHCLFHGDQIDEFDLLLDSSNMNMENWLQIAAAIERNYAEYDSFVVIHGTDTMR